MSNWQTKTLGELLGYEQPSKYLVKCTDYEDTGTPVLTANKGFVLGHTDEKDGIFCASVSEPVIIFDDFTCDNKYVDFDFKVKSSAIKMLRPKNGDNLFFVFSAMQLIVSEIGEHKRHWISEYQFNTIDVPESAEQEAIANILKECSGEIGILDAEIARTENLKKGLMQQVFSGKFRFKNDNGNSFPLWEQKKVGGIITECTQKTLTQDELPIMTSSRGGLIFQKEYYKAESRMANRKNIGYNVIKPNEITYRSRSDDGVFTFNYNDTGITGAVSYFYPVFRAVGGNSTNFVAMLLNYHWREISEHSVGTSQKVLSFSELKRVRLAIPSYQEQARISSFFTELNALIITLKSLRDETAKQKNWLLNNLVTGKIRLPQFREKGEPK